MGEFGYAAFACGFIVLVLVFQFKLKLDAKAWATKDLKRGDLHALTDVASGLRPDGLTSGQAHRLAARGMIRSHGEGLYRATLKGKLALRMRQVARHAVRSDRA